MIRYIKKFFIFLIIIVLYGINVYFWLLLTTHEFIFNKTMKLILKLQFKNAKL